MKVGIIYLAAGNSRRFGANKLLYELEGRPMYQHLLLRLTELCRECPRFQIAVVTQYEEIFACVCGMERDGFPVQAVYSPDSRKGASYSVRAGIRAVEGWSDACAFFVADQPYLTGRSAKGFLLEMERRNAALGSVCHEGTAGNPTWFARDYYPELLSLSGDTGGRKILKKYPEKVSYFAVEDGRELIDIDEPENYR